MPFALASAGKAAELPQNGAEWFTNVPVQTQDGRTLRFYDDVMKGKILLINFFVAQPDVVRRSPPRTLSAYRSCWATVSAARSA